MKQQALDVPREVIEALRQIRESGKYNMLDSNAILLEMNENSMYDAVIWLSLIDSNNKVRVNHERYLYALSELSYEKS